ncbi:MAG: hypothetical protein QXS20_04795 [Candidatus Thorarchaeota archaeon]
MKLLISPILWFSAPSSVLRIYTCKGDVDVTVRVNNANPPSTNPPVVSDPAIPGVGGAGIVAVLALVALAGVGGVLLVSRRIHPASSGNVPASKVLVVCPYCGAKSEQGITRCEKCGAPL